MILYENFMFHCMSLFCMYLGTKTSLYLTKHNTNNRQTSMPPVGFYPTISAGERPQAYAFDRAATGTGFLLSISF
jgi:hypothetical protein